MSDGQIKRIGLLGIDSDGPCSVSDKRWTKYYRPYIKVGLKYKYVHNGALKHKYTWNSGAKVYPKLKKSKYPIDYIRIKF